jgi:hypothetical protein
MLHSVGAVVAGFAGMALLVMAGSFVIIAAIVPGGLAAMRSNPATAMPKPTARYFIMNIALSLLAAIVGGWVTARIAAREVNAHLMALAAMILIMGIASAMTSGAAQPRWYKLLIPPIGVAGVAISALLTAGAS